MKIEIYVIGTQEGDPPRFAVDLKEEDIDYFCDEGVDVIRLSDLSFWDQHEWKQMKPFEDED